MIDDRAHRRLSRATSAVCGVRWTGSDTVVER
jgi:hypothetical protein